MPIWLSLRIGVGDSFIDSRDSRLRIGNEQIVATS